MKKIIKVLKIQDTININIASFETLFLKLIN